MNFLYYIIFINIGMQLPSINCITLKNRLTKRAGLRTRDLTRYHSPRLKIRHWIPAKVAFLIHSCPENELRTRTRNAKLMKVK